jgi:hypothetical protein
MNQQCFPIAFLGLMCLIGSAARADELLFPNSDFESAMYEGWNIEGNAARSSSTLIAEASKEFALTGGISLP